MNGLVFPLLELFENGALIVVLVFLGFIVLAFRTLMDILKFPFRNSDSKLIWVVCLFIFCIPTMILWWVGKNSR